MKVGILTLPLWHNYGGILQAYALRQAIEALGHETVFIDVRRQRIGRVQRGINRFKRTLRRVVRSGDRAPWYPDQDELVQISRDTRAFVQRNIIPRTAHVSIEEVPRLAHGFDAIVVGSDQVWRREYMPDLSTYFLAFGGNELHRISYAASLGVDGWLFSPEEGRLFGQSLARFRSISVREQGSVELLQREIGVRAVRVCDPTLLFDATYYCGLIGVESRKIGQVGRIFTYVLDTDNASVESLSSLVESMGGQAFSIMPRPFDPGFRRDRERYVFPRVEAWLQSFNDANMVITDSFHGCVFSLIFNRPFIAIANVERGRARFESLLGRFGLVDRLFSSASDVDVSELKPIDWDLVNKIRADEKVDGLGFLHRALAPEQAE